MQRVMSILRFEIRLRWSRELGFSTLETGALPWDGEQIDQNVCIINRRYTIDARSAVSLDDISAIESREFDFFIGFNKIFVEFSKRPHHQV